MTVEDQKDVVEAMRLDAVDGTTEQLEGTGVEGVDSTDDEKDDGDDERTGPGGTVLLPYAEIFSSFGLVERAAEEGDVDNAAFHLKMARMAFIVAHASKPVRQVDIRFFF